MLSPAAQHRTGNSTRRADLPTAATPQAVRDSLHDSIVMMQFNADYHRMSHIKSRVTRATIKRQVLTQYQAWLNTFMVQHAYESKDAIMFVWLTVWHIDVSQWQRGLELARYALAEGMAAPKDFSRSLVETVTEEIAGGILKAGNAADYLDLLDDLAQLVDGYDMTDQITAKLHKARALARFDHDPTQARELLISAAQLDPKAGVKRHLQALDAGGKPTPRKAADNIQDYSLSARAAATLANMTAPAFLRHAKKHPDLLPRLEIPVGTRHLYRFTPKHVKAYMKHHLVKTRLDAGT